MSSSSTDQGRFPTDATPRSGGRSGGLLVVVSGPVAGGKSTVSKELGRLGAVVFDADSLAHEALLDSDVREQVCRSFGHEILGSEGEIERSRLAARVFGDPERLKELTSVVHPWVFAELDRRISQVLGEERVVVVDVPLLPETAFLEERADLVLLVTADLSERRQRAEQIRGWKPGELERREALQRSVAEARSSADLVVENVGSREDLVGAVEQLWRSRISSELCPGEEGIRNGTGHVTETGSGSQGAW